MNKNYKLKNNITYPLFMRFGFFSDRKSTNLTIPNTSKKHNVESGYRNYENFKTIIY